MKKLITLITLAISVVALILFTTPAPTNAIRTSADYQRYITFHNDFDFPIYPVIQVPADICDGDGVTSVRRIVVNGPDNDGLQPKKTLTVLIPHESRTTQDSNGNPVVKRCWYQSGRIYIFPIALNQFEANMVGVDQSNNAQITTYPSPIVSVTCFEGKRNQQGSSAAGRCKMGVANNSFAADVPAQLAEYTFDSDNAAANNDPDTGIAMADIDVSNVDDFYLPIAASVVNNGATGYMGGARALLGGTMLSNAQQRINNFLSNNPSWSIYAAYLANNQPSPPAINNAIDATQLPKQLVQGKNTPSPHLPGGFNLIQNSLSRAASSVYQFQNNTPSNYLLSGVTYDPSTRIPSNPLMQPYVDRWMWWVSQFNPDDFQPDDPHPVQLKCSGPVMGQFKPSDWPDGVQSNFDQQDFCNYYLTAVKDVWVHFLKNSDEGFEKNSLNFYSDCGLYDKKQPNIPPPTDPTGNLKNACIIQHIVGYNSGVLGGQLPGEVQALLRGVAYNPNDGLDPTNKQYQYDPFLTFAAPYNSKFNLNPYTRLIHSTKDGIGAVSYSFSIDDKYGNFRDASVGILVDAGGTTILDNKQPYDPYQQYSMNWGYNRDKFSLLSVASGVNLADTTVQTNLKAIAANNNNQPFLIKQDQTISVFGHAAAAGDTWQLTNPLVTLEQLKNLAKQEYQRDQTIYYQDLINYMFGTVGVDSIFPKTPWDGNNQNTPIVNVLDFDAPSKWPNGQALLYGFISQQNASVSQQGNWMSADASQCSIPNLITINGPGSQRLPVRLNQPCQVTLTDTYGEKMVFQLTPVSNQVPDTYTGAAVTVMSLPVGDPIGPHPQITSNLQTTDLAYCQNNSTGRMPSYCSNINVSAVWSGDPLARDVVYMGLAFTDMPRVNVNLPGAPSIPPDTNVVSWPNNAAITVQQQGSNVNVSWTPAAASAPVNYTLYQWDEKNKGWPTVCQTSTTSCTVSGQVQSIYLYAIAINANKPSYQSGNLCYPATDQCPPANPGTRPRPRSPK